MQIQGPLKGLKTEEKLVTLDGVNLLQFKNIEANLTDVPAVNLTCLKGILEIVSPMSDDPETIKTTLGALLEAYMRFQGIWHYRRGGFTLEAEGDASSPPGESYSVGRRRQRPDLVIEVMVTGGSINRKDFYLPLEIPEVWFWQAGKIRIFQLRGRQYQEAISSQFFPELNIALLLKYSEHPDQYDAVEEFLHEIRS